MCRFSLSCKNNCCYLVCIAIPKSSSIIKLSRHSLLSPLHAYAIILKQKIMLPENVERNMLHFVNATYITLKVWKYFPFTIFPPMWILRYSNFLLTAFLFLTNSYIHFFWFDQTRSDCQQNSPVIGIFSHHLLSCFVCISFKVLKWSHLYHEKDTEGVEQRNDFITYICYNAYNLSENYGKRQDIYLEIPVVISVPKYLSDIV